MTFGLEGRCSIQLSYRGKKGVGLGYVNQRGELRPVSLSQKDLLDVPAVDRSTQVGITLL